MSSDLDLRLPAIAVAAWAGGLCGLLAPVSLTIGLASFGVVGLAIVWRSGRDIITGSAWLLVFVVLAGVSLFRAHQVAHNPVVALAGSEASVRTTLVVTSDPRLHRGTFSNFVTLRARVERITMSGDGGSTLVLSAPVLVFGAESWSVVRLGETLAVSGQLDRADSADLSAVLRARGEPRRVDEAGWWWSGADVVRRSLRDSVSGVPERYRALIPALVVGDDQGLDPVIEEDFRTTGLTHLLAVSGTNLTLVLAFVLTFARWVGVRGRWHYVVSVLGIAGFVLLARPEPSVLRAAAMGAAALLSLGRNGRQRGARTLGLAAAALLVLDPWLAIEPGFALSALATAGIIFVAPAWTRALSAWLPRWAAEAVAVPTAAQLACTPLVAALSGQVSLVAVATNLLAAPVVGPATVLGLTGGLIGLVWPLAGRLCGTLAGWCAAWLVAIAHRGAGLALPALDWGTGAWSLSGLTALCLVVIGSAPRLLRRRSGSLGVAVLLLAIVTVRWPLPGGPGGEWVFAVCDVGQGDALVLNAGGGAGVVVDAGPDPALVDRCLRRLRVTSVPLLVLTHFHADHVNGVAGVLRGREVGRVEVTGTLDPPDGVDTVRRALVASGLSAHVAAYDSTRAIGQVTLQVLWPRPGQSVEVGGDGSTANNASVVLLARVRGVTLLLAGDLEPEGQSAVAASLPALQVDVLKVPHHGSKYQDFDFLGSLQPRLALISVGADNTYGHPAPETLGFFSAVGVEVLRTDLAGDLVVSSAGGRVSTETSR